MERGNELNEESFTGTVGGLVGLGFGPPVWIGEEGSE